MVRIVAMTPAKVNLKIYQGATFRKRFRWRGPDSVTPITLVGAVLLYAWVVLHNKRVLSTLGG